MQEYRQDALTATVLCAEDSRRAILVKYLSVNRWTDEQMKAALAAYGSGWKQVQLNSLNLIMPDLAPRTWVSPEGVLAYKDMGNQLWVYAPELQVELRNQVAEIERQKKAVPKF